MSRQPTLGTVRGLRRGKLTWRSGRSRQSKAALRGLGEVRPKRQRGVIGSFGSPLDDIKGTEELNEFGSSCWQLQFDLEPIAKALDHLITAEIKKPRSSK